MLDVLGVHFGWTFVEILLKRGLEFGRLLYLRIQGAFGQHLIERVIKPIGFKAIASYIGSIRSGIWWSWSWNLVEFGSMCFVCLQDTFGWSSTGDIANTIGFLTRCSVVERIVSEFCWSGVELSLKRWLTFGRTFLYIEHRLGLALQPLVLQQYAAPQFACCLNLVESWLGVDWNLGWNLTELVCVYWMRLAELWLVFQRP